MRKLIFTSIFIATAIVSVASGAKLWLHSHSGNHLSMDASDVDSISFDEPGMLELSFYEKTLSNSGGRFTLGITANKPWTVSVNDPGLILGATSGDGDAQLAVTAMPNTDGDNPYTGIITVTLSNGVYKQAVVTVVSEDFTINCSKITMAVGGSCRLKPSNYSGTIEWSVSGDAAIITPSNGADCWVNGVKDGTATVTARNGDKSVSCTVTVVGSGSDNTMGIEAPGEGLTTIAIRIPEGTCNGVYSIGEFKNVAGLSNEWSHNKYGFIFEKTWYGWYKFTFRNDESFRGLRICAIPKKTDPDWRFSWGKNTYGKENVTLVKDDEAVVFEYDNDGLPTLISAPQNKVIYVDIKEWVTDPCAGINPAGQATITVTPEAEYGVVAMALVGNFTGYYSQDWHPESPYTELIKKGDSFIWTGEVPEACEFRILYKTAEMTDYDWQHGSKGNVEMPITNKYSTDCSDFLGL